MYTGSSRLTRRRGGLNPTRRSATTPTVRRAMGARVNEPAELLVIRDARLFDPSRSLDAQGDVVVEGGRITKLGSGAGRDLYDNPRARVIGGAGRWVLPAFVDLTAHLREPGYE